MSCRCCSLGSTLDELRESCARTLRTRRRVRRTMSHPCTTLCWHECDPFFRRTGPAQEGPTIVINTMTPMRRATFVLGPPRYRAPDDKALPHIMSFSGGRSSAALTFMAAEEGLLRPERGDAVLFANTSAEHPGTYEFAARCKERIEADFGLPCLWFEFCTVEDAWRGEYRRKAAYRLVKPVPIEEDAAGYRSSGELFEELVSLQGMLPNPHSRTCTAKLKLYPSHELLGEWLGRTDGPAHAGHYWPCNGGRGLVDPMRVTELYTRNGGTASEASVLTRATHLAKLPAARPAQRWKDFTAAPVPVEPEPGVRPARMRGRGAARHVRLLGLRADEPARVNRVLSRSLFAEGATTAACTVKTQPPGERPYFPLFDAGITGEDIARYWDCRKDFDLDIPEGAGNCVFCFMKGTRQLVTLAASPDERRRADTPTDVSWWADFERRYTRTAPRRNGDGRSRFGFFGVNSITFAEIAVGVPTKGGRYEHGTPACDCTD